MSVTIIAPGTESDEQYHRSGAWGSTLIGHFLRSPRLAHLIRTGKHRPPETTCFRFGRSFHQLMDPGVPFAARFRRGPDTDRRTTAWKEATKQAEVDAVTLLTDDEWQALHAMRESVLANHVACSLLEGAEHEVGFRMASPFGAYSLQCRADALHRWSLLADIKTTADIDDFGRSVVTYGYHRQAALYRWIVEQACGIQLPFSFLVVEKQAPLFRTRVFDLDPVLLARGWQEVEAALVEIGERTAADDWQDHRDAELVPAPAWLKPSAA